MPTSSSTLRIMLSVPLALVASCGGPDASTNQFGSLGVRRQALVAPSLDPMDQPFGNILGGDRRRLTGLNFNAARGATITPTVFIGTQPAAPDPYGVWTDDTLDILVPAAAGVPAGYPLDVTVDNGGPPFMSILPTEFTYYADTYRLSYPKSVSSYSDATAAVSADFDGDGYPDLAIVGGRTSAVQAFLNDTRGGFAAPKETAFPGWYYPPGAVASWDFDADGKRDLVLINNYEIQILLGNGDGSFRSGWSTRVDPYRLALADFDNDGAMDIAAISPRGILWLLMGQKVGIRPDGTFRMSGTYIGGVCGVPQDIKVTDLDGDGKPDLVLACQTDAGRSHGGVVTLYNTTGAAPPPVGPAGRPFDLSAATKSYLPTRNFLAVAALDLNQDGRTDLALTEQGSSALVVMQQQPNDPRFAPTINVPVGDTYRSLTSTLEPTFGGSIVDVCARFSSDGLTDLLLTAGTTHTDQAGILIGTKGGLFAGPIQVIEAGMVHADMGIADMNRDGCQDLFTIGGTPSVGLSDSALSSVLYGSANLVFQKNLDFPVGSSLTDVGLLRTGTGTPVMVTTDATAGLVQTFDMPAHGGPTVLFSSSLPGSPNSLVIGDIDGDSIRDVVTLNYTGNSVTVLKSDGHGGLSSLSTISVGGAPNAGAIGDVDGDGKQDLVVLRADGTVLALKGDGMGGFPTALASINRLSKSAVAIAVAGLYGMRQEVIVAKDVGKSTDLTKSDTIEIWQYKNAMTGFGMMPDYSIAIGGKKTKAILVTDIDRDRHQDLLIANAVPTVGESANFRVLLGDGMGGFSRGDHDRSFSSCSLPTQVLLTDVNADTMQDILMSCNDGPGIQTWLSVGRGFFGLAQQNVSLPGSSLLLSADLDGDRRPELVVLHQAAGGLTGTGTRADILRNLAP